MSMVFMGEICFCSAVLLLGYFLWQHHKSNRTVSEEGTVKKTPVLEEGTYRILRFFWNKKIFSMKSERTERLRKIYIGKEEESIFYVHYGKILRRVFSVVIMGLFLVSGSALAEQGSYLLEQYFLERGEYGESEKKYSIKADSGEEEKRITVKLPNRKYTPEEEKEVLKKCRKNLEKIVLGENKSAEEIRKPLHFIENLSGKMVSVLWEIPADSPVASDGTLKNSELRKPVQTELKAVLICGASEEIWTKAVIIFPDKKRKPSFWEQWEAEYEESEKKSETKRYVKLPEKVNGKQMKYFEVRTEYPFLILGAVFLICITLPVLEESRFREKIKKRQEQLSLDYPEFIEHFVLLIGAGMTVKGAWERIVTEYEKRKKQTELHFVYEEMAVTAREIENGMSETRAYELFGKRTELLSYMKFCTLLVQNLKKGSSDLLQILEYEMTDSFQARKENAKALGEKAGTKLLMPMAVMLVIVFVLILYAAFQNM